MSWLTQKSFTSFLLATLIFGRALAHVQPQTPKISTIKLEDFGWEPVPKPEYFEDRGAFSRNLWIDHEGRVLVGFTVRESLALATREHPGRSFHILRFTAKGKVDLSLVLQTDNWYFNGFYLGPGDQIFARANEAFQVLEDGTNKDSPAWRTLASCPRECYIGQSLSRRTLTLRVEQPVGGPDRSTYTILDASSSPPRVVRTCAHMAFGTITDRFVYWPFYDRDDGLMVRFPFCDVEHYEDFPMWGRGASGIIIDDQAFLKVGSSGARLLGPDGRVKFSVEMRKHDHIHINMVTVDERADRFAFLVDTVRGENRRLDIGGHLVARRALVYADTGQQLVAIPMSTTRNPDFAPDFDFSFSMSPDGHRLAILDGGLLTVADLD